MRHVNIRWPATTAVPTCEVEFVNADGLFATFGLFGTISIALPNGLPTFKFYYEKPEFGFRGSTGQAVGVAGVGHMVKVGGTAAPELIYETEGNLDVVGTDLPVGNWNARNTLYVPYSSTFVPGVGTNLLDIGDLFTALLRLSQPGQRIGYRGRLGYDCTGAGLVATSDLDYSSGSLGFYIKGMWQVGLGATGSQKTGLDIIRDVCTKNVIDNLGNPNMLDFYVDNTTTPPLLKVFKRGSLSSGTTFVVGTDAVQDINLPIDSQDIRNFVLYWSNPENVYPNGGDSWSNYDTTPHLTSQWIPTVNSGAGSLTVSSVTPYAFGTSNFFNSSGGGAVDISAVFDLGVNNYAVLPPARGKTQLSFKIGRTMNFVGVGTAIKLTVDDLAGHTAEKDFSASALPSTVAVSGDPTTWGTFTVTIPASGLGAAFGWATGSGWDWGLHTVAKITMECITGAGDGYYIDYFNFSDNWAFSPTYSYNPNGPTATTLTGTATAGSAVLTVQQTAGLSPGQYVVVEPGTAHEEVWPISSVGAETIILTHVLAFTHAVGKFVIGATHDPNSITQFKYRIFNFVDFYLNSASAIGGVGSGAGSDTADPIAYGILTQRKGKKSSGTITLSGYNQGISAIKPGYRFVITDRKDIFTGGSTDSGINSWIADEVEFDILPSLTDGFRVIYTVEPYYAVFGATSPDSNPRNIYRAYNLSPDGMLSRLYRTTQNQSVQP